MRNYSKTLEGHRVDDIEKGEGFLYQLGYSEKECDYNMNKPMMMNGCYFESYFRKSGSFEFYRVFPYFCYSGDKGRTFDKVSKIEKQYLIKAIINGYIYRILKNTIKKISNLKIVFIIKHPLKAIKYHINSIKVYFKNKKASKEFSKMWKEFTK